jgi:hypothetical protein
MKRLARRLVSKNRWTAAAAHRMRRVMPQRRVDSVPPWWAIKPCDIDAQYELAVCAIFKNEATYLQEWLEFHRLVGVEKFILYNNESTDEYQAILGPYIDEGIVTVYDIPAHPSQQSTAYNSCLEQYRGRIKWIAFIDLDEFLYPAKHDSLQECLSMFDEYPGLAVHWIKFNTSGHVLRPEGLVIENFVRCQPEGDKFLKLVVQASRTETMFIHHAHFENGSLAVNEQRIAAPGGTLRPPSVDLIRINHYVTKSVEEYFLEKVPRGNVIEGPDVAKYNVPFLLSVERDCGSGVDLGIARFVPRLKARIEQRGTAPTDAA